MSLLTEALEIDPQAETERIVTALRESVHRVMRRRGAVVGISGGVDSSVVLALSVKAFGPEKVAALMMPERESAADTEQLARSVARHFAVEPVLEDVSRRRSRASAVTDAATRRSVASSPSTTRGPVTKRRSRCPPAFSSGTA